MVKVFTLNSRYYYLFNIKIIKIGIVAGYIPNFGKHRVRKIKSVNEIRSNILL